MGIRETLNEKPGLTTAVTATIVALALLYIGYSVWPRSPKVHVGASRAFFTTDLGRTYQAMPTETWYEPDDEGKTDNVRAWVFRWPGEDAEFVAFLERVTPEVARKHVEARRAGDPADPISAMLGEQESAGHSVARPGEDRWVDRESKLGRQISQLPRRDGKYAVPVDPPE